MKTTDLNNITMESLGLPRELYWDGKIEPSSPPDLELFSISEPLGDWLYNDNFANEISVISDNSLDTKPGLDFPHELLDGDDLVVQLYALKDEHWNDSKLQSSQLIDYSIGTVITNPNPITKVQSPLDNINIFSLSNGDNAVLTQLTPPHSPPQNVSASRLLNIGIENENTLNDVLQQSSPAPLSSPTPEHINNNANNTISSPLVQNFSFTGWNNNHPGGSILNDDIAREMQIVDDIVNTRAKELIDWNEESDSISSYSDHPSQAESVTDEEWLPYSSAGSSPIYNTGDEQISTTVKSLPSKKRTRPYGRGVEDRKIRKKEQNKNAATRYRQKKKIEMEVVVGEEQQLNERNVELRRILSDCKREAKYLKSLLREFYQKKRIEI